MKMKKLPIGVADFKKMIKGNYFYVDKTLFIKEVIDSGDTILLIPRPRRFGKTLNLSMLRYFYDCCPVAWDPDVDETQPSASIASSGAEGNYKHLFDSLAISKTSREYLDKMGKYPVIFLSFKDIKELDWETAYRKTKKLIRLEYARHYYLMEGNKLMPFEREYFQQILNLKGERDDYENSLGSLLSFISRHYNKRVVILIDEYDAPIHAGYTFGYYDEIINFMRNFLGGGLKDTDQYLEKGVITGIMRIAKESIFSGFNNPGVYTLLSSKFSESFGFTENEVKVMVEDFQIPNMYDQIQLWYNGYLFGSKIIYNPWSIINFLNNDEKELMPYWLNTSSNEIIETLLTRQGTELKEELEQLIRGEAIEKPIDENIVLKYIDINEDSLWSFLLMGGYLKQTNKRRDPASGKFIYSLSIPNEEVRSTYTTIIGSYFSTKIENKKLEIMLKALIEGDIKVFEKMLRTVVLAIFSYHDFGAEPEKVYHALVAGLLVWISGTHEIKSNRESGYGRYDISIIPRDAHKVGYVIEFKAIDTEEGETVETGVNAAFKQIEDRKYETELVERGITNIKKLAIVFNGKDVTVREN